MPLHNTYCPTDSVPEGPAQALRLYTIHPTALRVRGKLGIGRMVDSTFKQLAIWAPSAWVAVYTMAAYQADRGGYKGAAAMDACERFVNEHNALEADLPLGEYEVVDG